MVEIAKLEIVCNAPLFPRFKNSESLSFFVLRTWLICNHQGFLVYRTHLQDRCSLTLAIEVVKSYSAQNGISNQPFAYLLNELLPHSLDETIPGIRRHMRMVSGRRVTEQTRLRHRLRQVLVLTVQNAMRGIAFVIPFINTLKNRSDNRYN